jgi:hypothetical protein
VWRHTLSYRLYSRRGTLLPLQNCHCKMCRSAHVAPVVAWLTVSRRGFSITAGDPVAYNSPAKATRCFCGRCGTPLTWQTMDNLRLIDVGIATLDDPAAVEPSLHIWTESRIAWFETADHFTALSHKRTAQFGTVSSWASGSPPLPLQEVRAGDIVGRDRRHLLAN